MHQPVRDRAAVIDQGFSTMLRWSIRIIAIALAAAIIGWIVAQMWVILLPILLALLMTSLLSPLAEWLRRKGTPHTVAAAFIVFGFILVMIGVIAILTPQVAGQTDAVAKSASEGLQKIRDWLTQGPFNLSRGEITNAISAVQDRLQASATKIASGVFSTIGTATAVIINLVLVLTLTFMFLKDGHKFRPWARGLAGARAGEHVSEVLRRSWGTLGGFMRTQSIVALIDAVIIGLGLVIIGVPLAIPLAVLTFIGGYVPVIGALVSGALAVLVAMVTNGPTAALIVLILVVAVQQLEGNVLSPWLQGKSMNLHAAVVLLAVTAGGTMFGLAGAFLAVPVVAAAAEILRYIDEQIDAKTEEYPEEANADVSVR